MKIGIVTTWFERGAAYVSKQYREELVKEHEVFLYVRGGEKFAIDDPNWTVDNLYWGKRNKYFAGSNIDEKDFESWITIYGIDVVFFNEQHTWSPVVLCNRLGVKVGAYIDYYKKDTVPLFNAYDFVICNTKRHYSAFKDHAQVHYVPWGTLTDVFIPRNKPDTEKGEIVFFHSAGMNPKRKGTDFILKAAHRIPDIQPFKILIHTQVDLLDFFPELRTVIEDLMHSGRLEIINKTITAPGIYHYGDVYVYPSRLEGIGLTVPEALSCGLPVVTTNQAPMNEFVEEGVNGKLIEVNKEEYRADNYYWPQSLVSVDSLTTCLEYYIEQRDQVEKMKVQARDYACQKLNWHSNAKGLGEIFKTVQSIDDKGKKEALQRCIEADKNIAFKTKMNSFLPYVQFKRKVKRLIK